MTDNLDRVIDIAKKLRKLAKKVDNQDVQSLIVDLNLCVADLKLQLVEQQEEALRHRTEEETGGQGSDPTPIPHPLAPTSGYDS